MTCLDYLKKVRGLQPTFNICKVDGRWRVATSVAENNGKWEVSPTVRGKQFIAFDKNIHKAINLCASLVISEIREYDCFEKAVWTEE